jgi:N-hydroxyarylamine O-acetyltransferase
MSDATELRDAYLARLGLDAEPPSVEALFRLHRAQVERVPYETLWIQLGELYGVDPRQSLQRVATTTRGGYCFHLTARSASSCARSGTTSCAMSAGCTDPTGRRPAS